MDPIDARELRGWLMNLSSHLGDAINLIDKINSDYPDQVQNNYFDAERLIGIKADAESKLEAMLGPETDESVEPDNQSIYSEMLDKLATK